MSKTLADLLIGKGSQGLNGPNRKKGMLVYMRQAMEANHPSLSVEDWTAKMVQNLSNEILDKAKSDVLDPY